MTLSWEDAVSTGMTLAYHANALGERTALVTNFGDRSYRDLNENANRLVRALRDAGLRAGDRVAIATRNRPEFVEAFAATDRSGICFTPINFHLQAGEIAYILENCEAKAFIADTVLGEAASAAAAEAPELRLSLSVGGALEGFDGYAEVIAGFDGADIGDAACGSRMLYTSGTTGRPKGVLRPDRPATGAAPTSGSAAGFALHPDRDTVLCTGPAYHAAPLAGDVITPLGAGVRIVMMDKWDAEESLRLIDTYRVTKCHMVATMFHRLLQLPGTVKARYNVSSLRRVVHGAAPTPVHVKRRMIEWFGPILVEYYAATEGGAGFVVTSEEWLEKPGTVGRLGDGSPARIVDENGEPVPRGQVGTIYFRAPESGGFVYYKDPEKTAASYRGDYYTLGDLGYFDEDGYLFLTGRSAEVIIAGGVNVYPQEVDDELIKHPAVLDVCTIGAPNEEYGEEVKAVVQLKAEHSPSEALSRDILEWARARLARYKCPRSIDYTDELPRLPSGKIQRRLVREPYWAGLEHR
jgi:long-chain acyl-CoA synthetase